MKIELIHKDLSGNYPIYLYKYDGVLTYDIVDTLEHNTKEVHIILDNQYTEGGFCDLCVCRKCPLFDEYENISCDNTLLFAKKYPFLLNTYPELFI